MRAVARRTAAGLYERVGFRGGFTVDGVLTADGFLPTELNPRWGAGLSVQTRSIPDLPLGLVASAAMEGEELDYRPAELEELVVSTADANRTGTGIAVVEQVWTENESRPLKWENGSYRFAGEDELPDGTLMRGPNTQGGFLRFAPVPDRCPVGPSLAPRVAAAFALADREWDAGIGPLMPAPELRR
jgi:hypothetical protein